MLPNMMQHAARSTTGCRAPAISSCHVPGRRRLAEEEEEDMCRHKFADTCLFVKPLSHHQPLLRSLGALKP